MRDAQLTMHSDDRNSDIEFWTQLPPGSARYVPLDEGPFPRAPHPDTEEGETNAKTQHNRPDTEADSSSSDSGLHAHAAWATPQSTLSPEELDTLAEKAQTPEDHLSLAKHYKAEAARLEKSAELHAGMGQRYRARGRNLPPKVAPTRRNMADHCDRLAKSLRDAAKASASLASSHEQMAKDLKQ